MFLWLNKIFWMRRLREKLSRSRIPDKKSSRTEEEIKQTRKTTNKWRNEKAIHRHFGAKTSTFSLDNWDSGRYDDKIGLGAFFNDTLITDTRVLCSLSLPLAWSLLLTRIKMVDDIEMMLWCIWATTSFWHFSFTLCHTHSSEWVFVLTGNWKFIWNSPQYESFMKYKHDTDKLVFNSLS